MKMAQSILAIALTVVGTIEMIAGYWLDRDKADSHILRAVLMFTLAGQLR